MATQTKADYPEDKKANPFAFPDYEVAPEGATPPTHTTVASEEEAYQHIMGETAADEASGAQERGLKTYQADGGKALKMFGTGLLAIVLPPVLVTGAAIASAGVMIYGCGKLLEGIGKGISVGPEMAYKAGIKPQVKKLKRVLGINRPEKDMLGPISV